MIAAWVIDYARLTRPTAVRDRDLDHRRVQGDLNDAPATPSARGVPYGVANEFGSDANHIIAGRALRQQPGQPTAQRRKLPSLTWKDTPPPHPERWCHVTFECLDRLRGMFMPPSHNSSQRGQRFGCARSFVVCSHQWTAPSICRSVSLRIDASKPIQAPLAHLSSV